jgi:hypothetical protein
MTPRAIIRMLAVSAAVTGSLALWLSPAKAAVARPSAGPPTGYSATLVVQTVPAIRSIRVILAGSAYATNAHGLVAIPTVSGEHRIQILPPLRHPAGTTVRFSRWLDGFALADRSISISPGTHVEQAGFQVSHPIAVRFANEAGRPVPASHITRVTLANDLGQRFTFSPARPPRSFAENRLVHLKSGLQPVPIRYSVRKVVIDGANVVYAGTQKFFVQRQRTWTIKVLLFPLRVEVRDALFGFAVGSAVRVTLPDGSSRIVGLGPGHAITITGLPRATYLLVAKGAGFGLSAPSTLTKPQVAKPLLFSWVDVLAVVGFLALFLVGLPVIGGRIVRGKGRIRLLAWHAGPPVESPASGSGKAAVPSKATGKIEGSSGSRRDPC